MPIQITKNTAYIYIQTTTCTVYKSPVFDIRFFRDFRKILSLSFIIYTANFEFYILKSSFIVYMSFSYVKNTKINFMALLVLLTFHKS